MKKQISGIYHITNNISGKKYIGSSQDIFFRFKKHTYALKTKKHHNKHLQYSITKHGITNFTFGIIEECSIDQLLIREQYYLDTLPKELLYNITFIAGSGGHDALEKPIYLLDLNGNIIKEYKSGADLTRDLNLSIAPYPSFNTSSVVKKKYRVVHVDYYNNNQDIIKSWKNYTCLCHMKKKLYNEGQFTVTKGLTSIKCKTAREVGKILGITGEGVGMNLKKSNFFVHKKSGYTVSYVKYIL